MKHIHSLSLLSHEQGRLLTSSANEREDTSSTTLNCTMVTAGASYVGINGRSGIDFQNGSAEFFDFLTKLPTKRLLLGRLTHSQTWSQHEDWAVLMISLDNFTNLNEAFGHEVGDLMLMQVAHRLIECLCANETLARVGGDKFAVLIGGHGGSSGTAVKAREAAEKVLQIFNRPFQLGGHWHKSSASIGIGLLHGSDHETQLLLRDAEEAMYLARKCGGSCFRFFDFAPQAELEDKQTLTEMMHEGFPGQFLLNFQVQVNHLGIPFGAEALLRWQHPEQGNIAPSIFIALAEETGLIVSIGAWVMESTCQQLAKWSSNPAMRHLRVSVNVSAREFGRSEFVNRVLSILDRTGADPSLLEIELTESVIVSHVQDIKEEMLRLKERGVTFSIDDFGTGYSSLLYLRHLPIKRLKIDQSFVHGIAEDDADAAIVRAVISLAFSLGIDIIAEGVETELQCVLLEEDGCSHFQGYLFGKPLALADFEMLLADPLASLRPPNRRLCA
jgi:diguanylate cyclase (GGDEF)-like protein